MLPSWMKPWFHLATFLIILAVIGWILWLLANALVGVLERALSPENVADVIDSAKDYIDEVQEHMEEPE